MNMGLPRHWAWRWARLALFALLLAGWECHDDEDDHVNEFGDEATALPLAFVDHPYEYRFEIPLGNAPYVIADLHSAPDWLEAVSTDGWSVTFSGVPTDVAEHSLNLSFTDEDERDWHILFELQVWETNAVALTGMWTLGVDVLTASGVCAGEENDTPSSDPAYIHQTGQDILLAGVGGDMGNTLHGYLYPPRGENYLALARLWGDVPEDDGSTEIEYRLDLLSWQSMSGQERWFWQGAAQSCEGTSQLSLTRVP